ncbi:MAG: hypothetical protein ABEI58_00910 [Candidatus Nanohaloarchaea archaeon]
MVDTPMLKRRLNPFLLASTILILSLLAGLSVLYQGQLSDMLSEKKQLKNELEEKKERISTLQARNANLSKELRTTENDRQRVLRLYESEKKKRLALENQTETLKKRIDSLESNVSDKLELVNELNESIGTICDLEYENMTSTLSQDQCEEWGHR